MLYTSRNISISFVPQLVRESETFCSFFISFFFFLRNKNNRKFIILPDWISSELARRKTLIYSRTIFRRAYNSFIRLDSVTRRTYMPAGRWHNLIVKLIDASVECTLWQIAALARVRVTHRSYDIRTRHSNFA